MNNSLEGKAVKQDTELRRSISLIIKAGYQIDKDAFEFLKKLPHYVDLSLLVKNVIEETNKLPNKPLFINREVLERKAKEFYVPNEPLASSVEASCSSFQAYAKEIAADLRVIKDPTNMISTTGSLEDYVEYFQDRFRRLSRILKSRMDIKDSCSILEALKASNSSKVKIICMITEKRQSSSGVFIKIEDLDASATIFAPSKNRELFQKVQRAMLDQVVCIIAFRGKSKVLMAEDIIFPDVPSRKPNKASVPVYAALISDLHVGSKMFMEKTFQRFIQWLKGHAGVNSLKDIASHVKYVIIAGDIVDGVGIYPQQIEELKIKDVYKQYQVAAKIIEQIPDYIEVIIIPGNHDATRRALPQPAISKDYAEPLYDLGRLHSLGDPSILSLHGVNVLLSHGRSLDDVISTVPGMSFEEPDVAMKFLLQCRHLAPSYGFRTLLAPEKVDHLVLEELPDIFHAGHVHMMKYSNYRGTLVVNSGAWQEQTEYQKEMGHIPNPGLAPIVNLQDLTITHINFGLVA
jgi:DNA polymerase II small subunit